MDFLKRDDGTLVLYFAGELNSTNAEAVEAEAKKTLEKNKGFEKLELDFSKLTYISSAGLRIIFNLKKEHKDLTVVEASLAVYDVLEMTGFTKIMKVSKAMARVDVNGAEVVGDGFFSTVYRINKDTIIKVFNRTSDPEQIERELHLAKQAFVLGIPTAISFDIVRVGDKLGVRFEMLDAISLKDAFATQPERYDELVQRYAELLKTINETDCMDDSLPNINEKWVEKLESIKPLIGNADYKKCKKLLSTVEESMNFVHGDCHFKNIMVQGDELLLIDMDTLSHGNALYELASIRAPYICFEDIDHGNTERFFKLPSPLVRKMYGDLVATYLGRRDESDEKKIAVASWIHMIWWHQMNMPNETKRIDTCIEKLREFLGDINDLCLGK